MASLEPLFIDIGGMNDENTLSTSLRIATYCQKYSGIGAIIRIACPIDTHILRNTLDKAKGCGVRNIVIERLEVPYSPTNAKEKNYSEEGELFVQNHNFPSSSSSSTITINSPLEMVAASLLMGPVEITKYIKTQYDGGDYFCIGITAYPYDTWTPPSSSASMTGGISTSSSPSVSLPSTQGTTIAYASANPLVSFSIPVLLEAQQAGAEFILSQYVLEANPFLFFRATAERSGISIPIIPSVLPLIHHLHRSTFITMNQYFRIPIPASLNEILQSTTDTVTETQDLCKTFIVTLCRDLLAANVRVLHFLTLNLEGPIQSILTSLGLYGPEASSRRKLPWRTPVLDEVRAASEDVRPIFWANRPAAYVERTSHWRQFPTGRWKTAREDASFFPFTPISDTQLVPPGAGTPDQRRAIWGSNPTDDKHVWSIFAGYMSGKVPRLPWCEKALLPETTLIAQQLIRLNKEGFLTINSQPRVNGARSDDPTFGWGGSGGLVYQKAYIECFMPPGHLAAFMEAASLHSTISYTAISATGKTYSSRRLDLVTAITWGVFPDREIQQPTIVDYEAFTAWKSEAFALWSLQWQAIYDEESEAADLISRIHDEYFLVNIIDNDFVTGDIFRVFDDALRLKKEKGERLPETIAKSIKIIEIDSAN